MTGSKRLLRVVFLCLAAMALFVALVYLFFPASIVDSQIQSYLAPQGLSLSKPCRKGVLPGVVWRDTVLTASQGELVRFNRLGIRPLLLPLVTTGRIVVGAEAETAGGTFSLRYGVTGKEGLRLAGDGIRLDQLPLFKSVVGADAVGKLWLDGALTPGPNGLSGEIRLEVKELGLTGVNLGGFPLPVLSRMRLQGLVRVTGNRARLESFTLQGEGLYLRLSGELPGGPEPMTKPLNLTLEVMPTPSFMEQQRLVFLLMARFAVSPGVYRLPVRGTLLKPEVL